MNRAITETMTARLDRLERDGRLWKWLSLVACAIGLIGGATAVLGLGGHPSGLPGRGGQDRIELRDRMGRMRAVLAVKPDGSPVLAFYDEQGRNRMILGLGRDGAGGFDVFQADGKDRIALGSWADGTSGMRLFDAAGRKRLVTGTRPDGTPTISLLDGAGGELPQARHP
jgi:hypothetical protein